VESAMILGCLLCGRDVGVREVQRRAGLFCKDHSLCFRCWIELRQSLDVDQVRFVVDILEGHAHCTHRLLKEVSE